MTLGVTLRYAEGSGLHGLRAIRARMKAPQAAFWRDIGSLQIARILASFSMRRDGRVVDGGGLENH